jgi:hypothetical protein
VRVGEEEGVGGWGALLHSLRRMRSMHRATGVWQPPHEIAHVYDPPPVPQGKYELLELEAAPKPSEPAKAAPGSPPPRILLSPR